MITRIWHGKTKPEDGEKYLSFLLDEGTREYRQTKGNQSAKVWKKADADACHFWTVTEWNSTDAIKDFAGEDFDKAKYYPSDQGILVEFEENVNHYQSFDVSSARIKNYINQLEQTFHGGNWLAESFDGKLNNLAEKEAFDVPMPGVHSVAEIVWHCIYWRTLLIKQLEGNTQYREATIETQNFLPQDELQKKGWPTILRELMETQSDLLKLLSEKKDTLLDTEYKPGFTFDYLILGTIQHDLYHLGQVGLVLKFLTVRGSK